MSGVLSGGSDVGCFDTVEWEGGLSVSVVFSWLWLFQVVIFARNEDSLQKAKKRIEDLTAVPILGTIYRSILEFEFKFVLRFDGLFFACFGFPWFHFI